VKQSLKNLTCRKKEKLAVVIKSLAIMDTAAILKSLKFLAAAKRRSRWATVVGSRRSMMDQLMPWPSSASVPTRTVAVPFAVNVKWQVAMFELLAKH